ncbi:MAG: periplasmic heavy metal sensor [Rhodobacteraceae bacterium]|nr:MAG: periplasmic heavy metal sensor [Paracoccaceae bacterium]
MADDTGQPSQPPRPPLPRRMSAGLRIVFFASLAMNVLIVSLVAGFVLRGERDGPPPRNLRDAAAPYTAALSREDRREIGRRMYAELRQEGARRDLRERAREEYREALDLLRAEPFDALAFAEVVGRQSARAVERQKRGEDLLVRHLATMSASERAAYADRVEAALEHGRSKRR